MEWISIKERLPDKRGTYLVTIKPYYGSMKLHVEKLFFGVNEGNIFWRGKYGRDNFEDMTRFITAWMPVPEPYKEDK